MTSPLDWIEAGRLFTFEDLVFWKGKGVIPFEHALRARQFQIIVCAPHATAAFPREMEPFINKDLTRREQFDFSDVMTSKIGRAWAAKDKRIVFIENPHPRAVLDANREPPRFMEADLREFFYRLRRQREGVLVDFKGIDAVRPITFAGKDVLLEPKDDRGYRALIGAIEQCIRQGVHPYMSVRDFVTHAVADTASKNMDIFAISLHDTMRTKIRDNGAIDVERPEKERMPILVNFGNKGDERGEQQHEEITMDAFAFKGIAEAWASAFNTDPLLQDGKITLNHPYKGAFEITHLARKLEPARRQNAVVGAVQVEFNRAVLLGITAAEHLHQPGTDWPEVSDFWIDAIVQKLIRASDLLFGD